jgi:hypothetical protein
MSGHTRLAGREQPPPSLVQNWLKRLEASPDGRYVNHHVRISAPAPEARQFPDSFVAFVSLSRFFPSDSLVRAQALTLAVLQPLDCAPVVESTYGRVITVSVRLLVDTALSGTDPGEPDVGADA